MTTDQTFIQGLYRVISCESIFENGQFTQQLAMIRVQNQVSNDPVNIPDITSPPRYFTDNIQDDPDTTVQ